MSSFNFSKKAYGTERTYIAADQMGLLAVADLVQGIRRTELWWNFAIHDIRQRFRRSALGPLWLTLSMGIMVAALGLVFSQIFNQDIEQFLPYLATGLIFWGFISTVIVESCQAFIASADYIRNVPMPISVHVLRIFARNVIVWAFNMAIYVIVYLAFLRFLNMSILLVIPGMLLLGANLLCMSFVVGILSARFRDIPQIIISLLQVVFLVTPIFWSVDIFPDRPAFISWNPFFHLLEIVRAPLLGSAPNIVSWIVCLAMIAIGYPVMFALYRRAYARIPYWV